MDRKRTLELAYEHIRQAYALLGTLDAEATEDVSTAQCRLVSAGRYTRRGWWR